MAHFRNCIDINIHYGVSCDRYYVIIVYYTVAFLSYLQTGLLSSSAPAPFFAQLLKGKRVDDHVGQIAFALITYIMEMH